MNDPRSILEFWFADGMAERWFKKDTTFDAELACRFEADYLAAAAGLYDQWRETAEGCVALVILLDQIPRNLFRDDPRAYATDAKAREVARDALRRGLDRGLTEHQRLFLYLPFEHSEDLDDQKLCVRLIAALGDDPERLRFAERHRDIVARFGRFPHRNAALGRPSTTEELAFLREPDSSF